MSSRQQLPPQIRKITVTDHTSGRPVVRYQVTVDAGVSPDTGRRKQTRMRFTTEKDARDHLSATQAAVAVGTYVARSKRTVRQVVDEWVASKHNLKASTLLGHKSKLSAVTDELGEVEVQKLSKAHLDALVKRLRAGEVEGRSAWSPRSVNYMLSIFTSALESELRQGNVVRNVAALVERMDESGRAEMKTLTQDQMFKIIDHECRDRHLWTLALYGLRRGCGSEVVVCRSERRDRDDRGEPCSRQAPSADRDAEVEEVEADPSGAPRGRRRTEGRAQASDRGSPCRGFAVSRRRVCGQQPAWRAFAP